MNTPPIDVSKWTRYHADKKHLFWWGILGVITIEVMVVLSFLVSYFYLWIVNVAEDRSGWPPSGTELPPLLYPTLNTALLLICAASMWYGGIVMQKGNNRAFVWSTIICCLSSALVLYFRWIQFTLLPFSYQDNAFTSFVWTLEGFHFLHVLSALIGTIVIGWLAAKGYYNEQRRLGVQIDTIYWYFVVLAWLPIYLVIYWTPRWGGP
jgi:cytochrome c oxidase subunit III